MRKTKRGQNFKGRGNRCPVCHRVMNWDIYKLTDKAKKFLAKEKKHGLL